MTVPTNIKSDRRKPAGLERYQFWIEETRKAQISLEGRGTDGRPKEHQVEPTEHERYHATIHDYRAAEPWAWHGVVLTQVGCGLLSLIQWRKSLKWKITNCQLQGFDPGGSLPCKDYPWFLPTKRIRGDADDYRSMRLLAMIMMQRPSLWVFITEDMFQMIVDNCHGIVDGAEFLRYK